MGCHRVREDRETGEEKRKARTCTIIGISRQATTANCFGTLWGLLLHGRRDTYWHLVESLRAHPGQGALGQVMVEVGFAEVELREQLGGISVIARGRR